MSGAVGQRRVPREYLEQHDFPLPPAAEQRRIVAKLDALTARFARARAELERGSVLAHRFRSSALEAAFAEGSCNGVMPVSDYCLSITDGDHQAPPQTTSGVPFITISAITNGYIDMTKVRRFVPPFYLAKLKPAKRPQSGDVLYTVVGATFGTPALVHDNTNFVFQRHIALLRPNLDCCYPAWLAQMMAAPQTYA